MIFILIRNEMIKLIQRRKSIVVIGMFILLLAFIGFSTYKSIENMKKWNKPETRIQNEQVAINNMEDMKKNPKISEVEKRGLEEEIRQAKLRIEEIKKEETGVKKDWRVSIKEEVKRIEEQISNPEIDSQEKERLNIELMTKSYLLDKDIQPEENSLNVTATGYLRDVFNILGAIFLVVGVIIFGSDMVSGEYTPATMKFLLTQPVSRGKVLLSKFIALILSATMIILVIEILAFLIMGMIFNFGNLDYPMTVGTRFIYDNTATMQMGNKALNIVEGSTVLIPMWKFFIRMFLLQGLFIITSASFAFLLSTVVKSSMVSMATTVVVIIVFTIIPSIPVVQKYAHYLFTTFGDVEMVLVGNFARGFNNPSITTSFVIGVMAIWSLISYVISHVVFTKKDILI